jgi:hypothetical protein
MTKLKTIKKPNKPNDCASTCRNVSQCEDGCIGYLGNNAEDLKEYPDDPNDTIDEDYENHLLEQSDNLQHYNRERDMGVGRW